MSGGAVIELNCEFFEIELSRDNEVAPGVENGRCGLEELACRVRLPRAFVGLGVVLLTSIIEALLSLARLGIDSGSWFARGLTAA